MDELIGGACKHNGAIGDKETVAVELYSSIYFESMHVAKIYRTCMVIGMPPQCGVSYYACALMVKSLT